MVTVKHTRGKARVLCAVFQGVGTLPDGVDFRKLERKMGRVGDQVKKSWGKGMLKNVGK